MQLSWIDPEALRDLAAKLQDPAPSDPRGSQSEPFHSLGVSKAIETDVFGFRLATEPVVSHPPAPAPPAFSPPSAPAPAPSPPQMAAEPEAHPVSHPTDEQVARIREQLQVIRSKAVEAGLLQPEPPPLSPPAPETPAPVGTAPPLPSIPTVSESLPAITESVAPAHSASESENPGHFLPLEGDLGRRLESYGQWANHRAPSEEMLLVDDHGDVLWGTATRSDLAFSALLSLNAALRSSADGVCRPPAVIRNQISENRQLTVLPCGTRHGTVTLAMLNAQPVPDSTLALLREALVTAVEGR